MIKIKYLFFVIIVLNGQLLMSQSSFGIRYGVMASTLSDEVFEYKPKSGLHLGVFTKRILDDIVAIKAELFFAQQGAIQGLTEDKIVLGYVNLPLLIEINTSSIFIDFGPQIGTPVYSIIKTSSQSNGLLNNQLTNTDFSIAMGGGIVKQKTLFGLRINLGISRLRNHTLSLIISHKLGSG